MSFLPIYRKTVMDLSNPKILVGYYVPYLVISGMMVLGITNDGFSDSTTLAQQAANLSAALHIVAFFLAVGWPFLTLLAVLTANTIAKEAESGTLRILLSKPTPRWTIVLASFAAVVSFSGLIALANLLLPAVGLYVWSGVHPTVISDGLFVWVPGSVAYGLFSAAFVTAVALAFSVRTTDRLKTTLGAFLVPALHFAFLPIRIFGADMYEEYHLFLVDVNYHFGHMYVFVHELFGNEFGFRTQRQLAELTGVYDLPDDRPEQLPESLELIEHVPLEASVVLLSALGVAALAFAVYRFQRMDV